ncbi:MAG: DinB family protein [candidate division Zixibacteria bacterium]|nr:DinB family protein [candidate division Zixibacteria bacterium]NIS48206.1 DinB family protein [candidate division Zixibacteria bacterium]NIT51350.1 DinB family protein [candidate division Zixibacteria bacterium]NIU16328.1 DinB family protein [candidate division Zixibacteria bacterium]NIX78616.1 hypothetical protein [candidate division Zixibacteria bacterium]
MIAIDIQNLAAFSRAVRESSMKRLRAVEVGFENWRPVEESMSFADIAFHLIEADRWLLKKLEVGDLAPILGRMGAIEISNRDEYIDLLSQLETTGRERADLIERLDSEHLARKIYDSRFGDKVSVWWIIMRGNLDHEIHHRGQLSVYLRLAGLRGES